MPNKELPTHKKKDSLVDLGPIKLSKTALVLVVLFLVVPYALFQGMGELLRGNDGIREYQEATVYLGAKKYDKAIESLKESVTYGNPLAMQMLGILHVEGKLVDKDYARARELFAVPVEKKFRKALFGMGYIELYGSDDVGRFERAKGYFEKAIDGSDPAGYDVDFYPQFYLGTIWIEPSNPDRNHNVGMLYLTQAYEGGIDEARMLMGVSYMSDENRDYDKAFDIFKEFEAKGFKQVRVPLAALYLEGKGTEKDCGKAFELAMPAAKDGEKTAMEMLAYMYGTGCGVEKNPGEAYYWKSRSNGQ